jgi:hypothetical protein
MMQFWNLGYWAVGFWSANFWAPAGVTVAQAQSFAPPTTKFFTVMAGQTTGGPSGAGTPYSVSSNVP